MDPTCPVVFMAALRTAVFSPPMSMQAAQLGLSVNMEAATATAINEAAITGVAAYTAANMAPAATEYPATETAARPRRSPNTREAQSVTAPPPISPTTLSSRRRDYADASREREHAAPRKEPHQPPHKQWRDASRNMCRGEEEALHPAPFAQRYPTRER